MELKLLEDFLCLNETRNFSRAAEARHITQSTLSKRIRALEHWVGTTLIDRSSYPIELTPRGSAMVAQARELVAMFQAMKGRALVQEARAPNAVNIGALHTLRVTFLPEWRRRIELKTGPWALKQIGSSAAYAQTLRDFRNGQTDMLLTYVHPDVPGLDPSVYESIKLGQDVVVPVSVKAEDGSCLHNLDDDEVRLLSYGSSSFFGQALAAMLEKSSKTFTITASNSMSVGLQSLAKVGCGVAWIPYSLAKQDLDEGTLVLAGHSGWFVDVEIRVYRPRGARSPFINRIWNASCKLGAEAALPLPGEPPARSARLSAA